MTLKIVLDGKLDISELVKGVKLSGHSQKFNRQLDVDIIATTDGRTPTLNVELGSSIAFYYEDKLRYTGVVFALDLTSSGDMTLTTYDANIYLAKSQDTRIFTNKKASDIIRILANDFGIAVGQIADTGYVIPYLKLANQSLFDMITKALVLTYKQTGKRYFVGNDNGKLTLTAGVSKTTYLFSDKQNLISASYTRSIEDVITQVKVIGGAKGKETVIIAKDDEKRKKYGVLQIVEEMDEESPESQIKQRAQTLLAENSKESEQFSIDTLGVIEVDVGTPVYVYNEMTRTNRAFYVTDISHNISSDIYTMSMQLTRTLELPDVQISDDETKQEAK